VRPPRAESLPPLPPSETAPPEPVTRIRPGLVRYDRLDGLTVGTDGKWNFEVAADDPLSAVAEMQRTITVERGAWRVRTETTMRMSCTRESFRLTASLRAFDGDNELAARDWDSTIARDLV
jgi:hypothetical protein